MPPDPAARSASFRGVLLWVVLLGAMWWILAGPRADAWIAAVVAVGVGLWLRRFPGPGSGLRPTVGGSVAFVPYFAWQSIKGGWDVSRRALAPSPPLDPSFLTYELVLPEGAPRVFMTNALSLMPGTFGARLRGDELTVHLLVGGPDAEARVRELERKVARLFGVEAA